MYTSISVSLYIDTARSIHINLYNETHQVKKAHQVRARVRLGS